MPLQLALLFFLGAYFIMSDLVDIIDWKIITFYGRPVMMTFLFHWKYLLFTGFVSFISSLAIPRPDLLSSSLLHQPPYWRRLCENSAFT